MRQTLIAAACGLLFTPHIHAASGEPVLGEMVVTASRIPVPIAELTSDVTVLNVEDIQRSGAASLPELLQSQPGLEVTSSGGLGTQSALFLRGSNANHTLILVDGMRVNSATVGTTAIEHIPLSQIERIEIVRAPGSSLYGSDAIGGVIQIFTRASRGTPGMHLEAGVGSFNTYRMAGGITRADADYRLSAHFGYLKSDGFDATKPGTYGHNPDRDGYRNQNATFSAERTLAPGHAVGLNAFMADGRTEFDGSATKRDEQKQTLSSYAVYSRNQFLPNWQSLIRVGESTDELRNPSFNSRFQTEQRQYEWQNDVKLAVGTVTLATQRVEQRVSSTTAYAKTNRDDQSYQAGYQLSQGNHAAQVNVRHDDDSQFGGHGTGFAAYGYRFAPGWRATASIGTAFKAPTFNDLYYVSAFFKGNPNLRPESSISRELGVHWQRNDSKLSAALFRNQIKDLIAYASGTMVNINRADIQGFSLHGSTRINDWTVKASLDFETPEDANSGRLLPRRSKEHASLELGREIGPWSLRGQVVASAYRYDDTANLNKLDGYGLVNLAADYQIDKSWRLSGRINNALDKRYELVKGYNTAERNIFVGLSYQPR